MKTTLTITDVTGMAPPFVCVAGVNSEGHSIRLQFPRSRIDEDWLCHNGVAIIRPFSRVGFLLKTPRPDPPHSEDWFVDPCPLEAYGLLEPAEQARFLSSILDPCVAAVFGSEIFHDPGYYVLKGRGNRSLGTIRAARFHELRYHCYEAGWDCRIRFTDEFGEMYSLKVKDLTLCTYLDFLREQQGMTCEQIEQLMRREIGGKECYLRIGLARGWASYPDRCYLQVTGVFPFPDYLKGRWFADFKTPDSYRPGDAAKRAQANEARRLREPSPGDNYTVTPTTASITLATTQNLPRTPLQNTPLRPGRGISYASGDGSVSPAPEIQDNHSTTTQVPPSGRGDVEEPVAERVSLSGKVAEALTNLRSFLFPKGSGEE